MKYRYDVCMTYYVTHIRRLGVMPDKIAPFRRCSSCLYTFLRHCKQVVDFLCFYFNFLKLLSAPKSVNIKIRNYVSFLDLRMTTVVFHTTETLPSLASPACQTWVQEGGHWFPPLRLTCTVKNCELTFLFARSRTESSTGAYWSTSACIRN